MTCNHTYTGNVCPFCDFANKMDWRGIANAFSEGNIDWHAKEWETFVNLIRLSERKKVIEEMREIVDTDSDVRTAEPSGDFERGWDAGYDDKQTEIMQSLSHLSQPVEEDKSKK